MKNILLLKAGEAAVGIRRSMGDYDAWFRQAFGRAEAYVHLHVISPYLESKLPNAREYDLIVMTGSPQSLTRPTDWMRHAADYLRIAIESQIPVLGVCFGHQLLGYAYGSRVVPNARGREIGTVDVDLLPEGKVDPLFHGVPQRFQVQATHEDIVETAPPEATVLARNALTDVQAMAVGAFARGVQFHPELSSEGMIAVIQSRVEILEQEWTARGGAGSGVTRRLAGVGAAPHGARILSNFVRLFERG